MRKMSDYTDEKGLIVHRHKNDPINVNTGKKFNGGDTCNRMGIWYYSMTEMYRDSFIGHLQLLAGDKRLPDLRRYHRPLKGYDFWTDYNKFSRDQRMPIVIALGKYADNDTLYFRNLLMMYVNYGKVEQNGDMIGPMYKNAYRRSLKIKPSILGDIELILNSILQLLKGYDNISDDIVHSMLIHQSMERQPTFLSKIARWIYRFRKPQIRWDRYFRDEMGAPPLNKVAQRWLKEI